MYEYRGIQIEPFETLHIVDKDKITCSGAFAEIRRFGEAALDSVCLEDQLNLQASF